MTIQALHMDRHFAAYAAGAGGKVHSVYRRTVNLWAGSNLYTVLSEPEGIGPYTACVERGMDFRTLGVVPGALVLSLPGGLQAGCLQLDCSRGLLWEPDPAPGQALAPACPQAGIRQFELWLQKQGGQKGCAGCYQELYMKAGPSPELVQRALCLRISDLTASYMTDSPETAVAAAWQLIGLGGGLTPAGDDFLCGFLLALHRWGGSEAQRFLRVFRQQAAAAAFETTAVSGQMLKVCLNEGLAMQMYLSVCDAFLKNPQGLPALLSRAAQVGHTSGLDTCSGMAAGLRCLQKDSGPL